MINYAIQPINFLDSVLSQSWFPAQWPTMQREINPWNDPYIDRLNLHIFNLKRQVRLRSIDVCDNALHRLGHKAEWIIESEFDFYLDSLCTALNILRAYIWDHYLQADIDSFMAVKKPLPLTDVVNADSPPLAYGPVSLVQGILNWQGPGSDTLGDDIQSTRFDLTAQPALKHRTKQYLQRWETIGPRNHLTQSSLNHLLYEFAVASGDFNALSGPAAKQRILFLNEAIPLPNEHTILAWWHLCGLSAIRLTEVQKQGVMRITEHEATHLICFNLPSLPMTQEHASGAPNPGEDSQTDHSLPGRSSAHDRTVHGRIIHGRWESYSYVANIDNGVEEERGSPAITIDSLRHGGFTGRSLIYRHWSAWPFNYQWYQPEEIFDREGDSCVFDPYLAHMYPLPVNFHAHGNYEFDTGMRSLAKWHRVHLRFSDDPLGALAATEWRTAFMDSIARFLRSTDNDRILSNFHSALIRQERRTVMNTGTAKRGRPKKNDQFNFAAIFGTDSDD